MSVPDCLVVLQASLTVLYQDLERRGLCAEFCHRRDLEGAVHPLRQLIMETGHLRRTKSATHAQEQAYG